MGNKRNGIQRERQIIHGNYKTVHVFPVFPKGTRRSKKCKPSSEVQKKLNQKYREEKIRYLLDVNFDEGDIEVGLGYDDKYLPDTYDECKRDIRNFHRRVNRFRTAIGLDELKYLYCIERGARNGRWHIHDTMSGGTINASDETIRKVKRFFKGMDENAIKSMIERGGYKQCIKVIWGKGYAHTYDLDFNEEGLKALAKYKVKEPETESAAIDGKVRRWSSSKNLKQAETIEKDNRISKRTVEKIRRGEVTEREIERLYPGYIITNYEPLYNSVNGGEYLTIHLYKKTGGKKSVKKE